MVRLMLVSILLLLSTFFFAAVGQATDFYDPLRPHTATRSTVTEKAVAVPDPTVDWRLTAVLISAQRSVAIINGSSFRPGDQLEGFRLVSIFPDRVILKKNGTTKVLHRVATGLKKTAR